MSFNFPEGSKFQFSSSFGSALTISTLTNATDAVATSTSHGLVDNDEILLTSGWEDATNTVYRADQQDANSFKVLGLDSSNTTYFGTGTGTGSAQKISSWVDIPQVLSIDSSGGDARFTQVQLLASRNGIQIPTGFNPFSITLTVAHDPANANWKTMLGLSRTFTKVAFRIVGAAGTAYMYGYMVCNEVPKKSAGQVDQASVVIAGLGRIITY